MRVVAVADFTAHGYHMLLAVGISVFDLNCGIAADIAKFESTSRPNERRTHRL